MRPWPGVCNCASHRWALARAHSPVAPVGLLTHWIVFRFIFTVHAHKVKQPPGPKLGASAEGLWRSRGTLLESDVPYAGVNPAGTWSFPSRLELWAKGKAFSYYFAALGCMIAQHPANWYWLGSQVRHLPGLLWLRQSPGSCSTTTTTRLWPSGLLPMAAPLPGPSWSFPVPDEEQGVLLPLTIIWLCLVYTVF